MGLCGRVAARGHFYQLATGAASWCVTLRNDVRDRLAGRSGHNENRLIQFEFVFVIFRQSRVLIFLGEIVITDHQDFDP